MSAFWGYMWLALCIIVAVALWGVNTVFVDNAFPAMVDKITSVMDTPICDMSGPVKLLIKLEQISPLFIAFLGIGGWILECTVWGRRDYYE
jgi:hypothetical protein